MPRYDHQCLNSDCSKISDHMYSLSKDPKEIKCPECGGETKKLIGNIHIGWDRKIYNTFIKGDDERAEAQEKDHMGPTPYNLMQEEQES